MNYTRFEFGTGTGSAARKYLIGFTILIPAIAILIGFLLSKFVVIPGFLKGKGRASEKAGGYAYQVIKDRKFYILQGGIFQSESNAKLTVQGMKSHNLTAYIRDEGQLFRVVAGVSLDRAFIAEKVGILKTAGYSCIIKELNVRADELPAGLRSDSACLLANAAVKRSGELIDTWSEILSGFVSKRIDHKRASSRLKSAASSVETTGKELDGYGGENADWVGEMSAKCKPISKAADQVVKIDGDEDFLRALEERLIQSAYSYEDLVRAYNARIAAR